MRIEALLDIENPAPHALFLQNEINFDLFNKFQAIVEAKLTEDSCRLIGIRLAQSTSASDEANLLTNVRIIRVRQFSSKVENAFLVKNEVTTKLLGNEPWTFFDKSNEFNPDLYREFADLLVKLLAGKDCEAIGKLLAHAPKEQRDGISHQLENMTPSACAPTHPLKLIAAAFRAKAEMLTCNNRSSFTANIGTPPAGAELRQRRDPSQVTGLPSADDELDSSSEFCGTSCILF